MRWLFAMTSGDVLGAGSSGGWRSIDSRVGMLKWKRMYPKGSIESRYRANLGSCSEMHPLAVSRLDSCCSGEGLSTIRLQTHAEMQSRLSVASKQPA